MAEISSRPNCFTCEPARALSDFLAVRPRRVYAPFMSAHLKDQLLAVLHHPEAEDGLYFRNFFHLHEADEREQIEADPADILSALLELVEEGYVTMLGEGDEAIFAIRRGGN